MTRTVEFLENTAKKMPNREITYGCAMVTWVSYKGQFMYDERFPGGSTKRVTRDEINELFRNPSIVSKEQST